jgi:hypothetical protein
VNGSNGWLTVSGIPSPQAYVATDLLRWVVEGTLAAVQNTRHDGGKRGDQEFPAVPPLASDLTYPVVNC